MTLINFHYILWHHNKKVSHKKAESSNIRQASIRENPQTLEDFKNWKLINFSWNSSYKINIVTKLNCLCRFNLFFEEEEEVNCDKKQTTWLAKRKSQFEAKENPRQVWWNANIVVSFQFNFLITKVECLSEITAISP